MIGNPRVNRVVCKRNLISSPAHCWWPRGEPQAVNDDETDRSHAQDSSDLLSDNEGGSKRIHILGAGNLGAFVAHSLAGIPSRPPITLLLGRRQLQNFMACEYSINLSTRGIKETRRGFDVELLPLPTSSLSGPKESSQSPYPDQSNRPQKADEPTSSLAHRENFSMLMEKDVPKSQVSSEFASGDSDSLTETIPTFGRNNSDSILRAEGSKSTVAPFLSPQGDDEQSQPLEDSNASEGEAEMRIRISDDVIYSLVITVKAMQVVRAIERIAHRLTRESTILFLQNGMGFIEEVNEKVFPDEKTRPTYIVGIVSHGLYSEREFSIIHAGEGTIALGALPRKPMDQQEQAELSVQLSASARYLLRTITRTPVFVAVGFPPTDLMQQQLDKFAVNCIINPLTALLDCQNGALLTNTNLTRVIRLLLAEISLVIKNLPDLKNVPNVNMRFSTHRLEALVFAIAKTTAANNSSMLQDFRAGRSTEIDYINGYIIKRGQEMGVHCVMNYMLLHMVKGKRRILLDKGNVLPFVETFVETTD